MNESAIRIRVTGHVQGVGFRAYVKARADERSIRGWVCNHTDGSVHVLSILPEEGVDSWIEIIRTGPARSVVEALEVWQASPEETGRVRADEGIQEFRIERTWE